VPLDQRDEVSWVALELTRQGELKVEDSTLARTLRQDLDLDYNHPIFIPSITYKKGKRGVTIHLMEGYAFVAAGLPDYCYFALEQKPYVEQVISVAASRGRTRNVSVIPDRQVQKLRRQLHDKIASDIRVGERVCITEGQYRRLEGEVTGIEDMDAHVFIKLRSLQVIATVPRVFLESLDSEGLET